MAYTELCGSKLRDKMGAVLNEAAVSHSPATMSSSVSFAKRQLEKMGWTEGTGLGKNRDGMVEHLRVKQREAEIGLGREKVKVTEAADVWWKDTAGGTLAKLQRLKQEKEKNKLSKKGKKEKKKRKKDKKRESAGADDGTVAKTFTDEELYQATGGARFGMRAQRRAEGKWKRTESGADLTDLEKKALKGMEWNGRGKAKVVVVEKESNDCEVTRKEKREKKKRKRPSEDDGNDGSAEDSSEKEVEENGEGFDAGLHQVTPTASDGEFCEISEGGSDGKEDKRQQKKKKKERKEEKKREKKMMETVAPDKKKRRKEKKKAKEEKL